MNNIKLIKDENEKEIINMNKVNNNMYKSISENMRENKRKKLNTPISEKHNYRTKENIVDINKYNNYSPNSLRDKTKL
jgi:hypothetical protein